jgi:hypothetical protein
MRQPTVGRARRRTRQQRLLRTAIGVVIIVVLAALIANLVGGKKSKGGLSEPGVQQVAFIASVKGETDASSKPSKASTQAQASQVVKLLNEWYQRSFVDPKLYGDGTFPEITKSFTPDAKAAFLRDATSLTIGEARTQVKSVALVQQTAKVTIFFDKTTPKFAIAAIHFTAIATLKDSNAYPLKIAQDVTYNFQKAGQGWVVTYYKSQEKQKSAVPSPSPSATSS